MRSQMARPLEKFDCSCAGFVEWCMACIPGVATTQDNTRSDRPLSLVLEW